MCRTCSASMTSTPVPSAADPVDGLDPLVPGSAVARALYLAWSGEPVVVVDSPPGAGKSTLITQVVAHLTDGADLAVAVITPTRRQAVDIGLRIAAKVPPRTTWLAIGNVKPDEIPPGRSRDV